MHALDLPFLPSPPPPQTKLGKKTQLFTINPKAITVAELYGVLDPDTRDWTDGLLSNIFREINKPLPADKDEARWVGSTV
jgi:dynein heavy chain